MKTVHEVSAASGVSVRTLHHYDAVGLLRPTAHSAAGYRLYDDAALARLQTILLFRELRFPLKEIKAILESPHFDPSQALRQQIALLELEQKRLARLLALARQTLLTGVTTMDKQAFDRTEIEQYAAEARARWGDTDAWRQYAARPQDPGADSQAQQALLQLLAGFGALHRQGLPPQSAKAQALVAQLQQHISAHFYTCTDEILAGLGQMYTADERFTANIDAAGGNGTAAFAADAIRAHCGG